MLTHNSAYRISDATTPMLHLIVNSAMFALKALWTLKLLGVSKTQYTFNLRMMELHAEFSPIACNSVHQIVDGGGQKFCPSAAIQYQQLMPSFCNPADKTTEPTDSTLEASKSVVWYNRRSMKPPVSGVELRQHQISRWGRRDRRKHPA